MKTLCQGSFCSRGELCRMYIDNCPDFDVTEEDFQIVDYSNIHMLTKDGSIPMCGDGSDWMKFDSELGSSFRGKLIVELNSTLQKYRQSNQSERTQGKISALEEVLDWTEKHKTED